MTDDQGRHAADRPPDVAFARPDGVGGGFEPRPEPVPYRPPPPTAAPQDRDLFGRPAESGAAGRPGESGAAGRPGESGAAGRPAESGAAGRPAESRAFAPQPGDRLAPRPTQHPVVPNILAETFSTTPDAREGFAPSPGDRIGPRGPVPESPWWTPGALRDPWRDPSSAFWLGRGAVFAGGRPAQLGADQDTVSGDLDVMSDEAEDEDLEDRPDNVRRLRFGLSTLATIIVITLLAGAVGGGAGWLLTEHVHDALHRPDISIAKVKTPVDRPATSVAGIAKRVGPTVVSIAVKTAGQLGIGSGVVIDGDGYVLTNNHVVAAAAGNKDASIVVTFSNEDTAQAEIVGRDATSDLAVIKVPNDQLTVAQLGDSDAMAVGDPVIAIGSPLGLQGTVTAGIVSALERPVHVFSDDGSSDAYLDAIQTDAPINPGNSGGALVNSSGAVVGINSAAALGSTGPSGSQSATTGIGYAIPINYARGVAQELIRTGHAVHATFGAQGRTVISGVHVGGYLVQISPGGAAAKAGLEAGDVIVAAGGKVIQTFDQLVVIVQEHKPGDHISVTYYPRGASQKVTKTIELG